MGLAESAANSLALRFGRSPWSVASGLGIPVHRAELPGRHRELYIEERSPAGLRVIVVASDASDLEARHLIAHGLAHAALHVGNRVARQGCAVWTGRHEREAEDFAACLLIDGERLREAMESLDPPSRFELAERFEVDEALMERRLALLGATQRSPA